MYSTVELQIALVNTCHTMLRIGSLKPRWPNTLATLFPGTGGTNDAYPVEVMGSMVEVLQRPHTSTWAGCWWATWRANQIMLYNAGIRRILCAISGWVIVDCYDCRAPWAMWTKKYNRRWTLVQLAPGLIFQATVSHCSTHSCFKQLPSIWCIWGFLWKLAQKFRFIRSKDWMICYTKFQKQFLLNRFGFLMPVNWWCGFLFRKKRTILSTTICHYSLHVLFGVLYGP